MDRMNGNKLSRKLMLLLIAAVPFSNQLINININLAYIQYLPFIGMMILFLCNREMFDKSRQFQLIFVLFLCAYTVSPFIGLTVFKYNPVQNLIYVILFLIYIAALKGAVSFIDQDNYKSVIKATLIGNSILLIINLLLNLNDINIENYNWLLKGVRESRGSFGFLHPNTAGMFMFLEIILIYFASKLQIGNRYVWYPSILLLSACLIATGSRTAVYSTALFFGINWLIKGLSKVDAKLQIAILFGVIMPAITFALLKFDYQSFLEEASGRNSNLLHNLNILEQENALVFGVAPINVSEMKRLIEGLTLSDNWYMTQLIQFGFIGLSLFVCIIVYLLMVSIKNSKWNVIVLLIIMLFYSGAENVMFIPGVLISWVIWIMILSKLKLKELKL